jgi:hypothetical protein
LLGQHLEFVDLLNLTNQLIGFGSEICLLALDLALQRRQLLSDPPSQELLLRFDQRLLATDRAASVPLSLVDRLLFGLVQFSEMPFRQDFSTRSDQPTSELQILFRRHA